MTQLLYWRVEMSPYVVFFSVFHHQMFLGLTIHRATLWIQEAFWSCPTSADTVMQYTPVQPATHVEMTAKSFTLMCNVSHCQHCLYNRKSSLLLQTVWSSVDLWFGCCVGSFEFISPPFLYMSQGSIYESGLHVLSNVPFGRHFYKLYWT